MVGGRGPRVGAQYRFLSVNPTQWFAQNDNTFLHPILIPLSMEIVLRWAGHAVPLHGETKGPLRTSLSNPRSDLSLPGLLAGFRGETEETVGLAAEAREDLFAVQYG